MPDPTPRQPDPTWNRLAEVRRIKSRSSAPLDVSRLILGQLPEVRKMRRQLAAIAEIWAELVPPDLAALTRLEGVSRGVLLVRAADAAARFELDRFLRSGGETRILAAAPLAIRRVRVTVDDQSPQSGG